LVFSRQVYQGKYFVQVSAQGGSPQFASLQVGAYSADGLQPATEAARRQTLALDLDPAAVLSRPQAPAVAAQKSANLADAEVIVAVGRAIKGAEHLEMIERLAELLGGQVGATRAVCDEGWLPIERQIGSSGQIVAPRLYVALGISGAIQHLVGMQGAGTVVAVNKDPDAPIFSVADYAIVGDIFEVVPALIAELEAAA
jgi:electron transfer flavoprotein alpha subunit